MTLADDVALSTKPYFSRKGLQESRYTLSDPAQFGRPASPAPLRRGRATTSIDGVPVEIRETVKRREAKLPYGDVVREVRSVPRIAVSDDASERDCADRRQLAKANGRLEPLSRSSLLHNAESCNLRSGRASGCPPAGSRSRRRSHSRSRERESDRRIDSR